MPFVHLDSQNFLIFLGREEIEMLPLVLSFSHLHSVNYINELKLITGNYKDR